MVAVEVHPDGDCPHVLAAAVLGVEQRAAAEVGVVDDVLPPGVGALGVEAEGHIGSQARA